MGIPLVQERLCEVPERVDVRADMVALDDHATGCQPGGAILGRSDSLGELFQFSSIEIIGRATRGRRSYLMYRHTQINQFGHTYLLDFIMFFRTVLRPKVYWCAYRHQNVIVA